MGPPSPIGVVWLVGAGPGDPGLLTIRARELLDECDAIVYDALANPVLLARSDPARARAELHDAGKRGGDEESHKQEDITRLLIELARAGKRVVRLKGGDPLVFGRGSEEAQALAAAGVPFEIVPGVTAGVAAPAFAGIPVTHRGLATSVTFVTGHEDPAGHATSVDWGAVARTGGTIVLYMGLRTLPRVAAALVAAGMRPDMPAAAVQWGTYPRQRTIVATITTLAERAAAAGMTAPAITVIGPVVTLREQIAWYDRRPLFGRRIVVTRAATQAAPLSAQLQALGAEVVEMPATRIEPLDPAPLRRAVADLATYRWVVFTSQNAVALFFDALAAAGRDARAFAGAIVAAIGPATGGALAARGLRVDVTPGRFVAEGLLEVLAARPDVHGARVLYATAEGARGTLPSGLREAGAIVDVVAIYRSAADGAGAAGLRARLERGEADLITFTSAAAVRGLVDAVGADAARRCPAVTIGPVTSAAARAAGITVAAEGREATIAALVAAVGETLTPAGDG